MTNTDYEVVEATQTKAIEMRIECLIHGLSTVEDIEGLLFIREGDSVHVEANGRQLGGNYLIPEDGNPFGMMYWAKKKVEQYAGPDDEEDEDPEVMIA